MILSLMNMGILAPKIINYCQTTSSSKIHAKIRMTGNEVINLRIASLMQTFKRLQA